MTPSEPSAPLGHLTVTESEQGSRFVRRVEDAARALADVLSAFERDEPPMKNGRPDIESIGELAAALDDAWSEYASKGRFFDL